MNQTQKLYQSVASDISRRILSGEFKTHAPLPSERDLSKHYEVSRATIREACIALEIQGWVHPKRGAGVFVTDRRPEIGPLTDLDIGPFELTEARRALEGEAAAIAARVITEQQLQELEQILNDMISVAPDSEASFIADERFHLAIAQATQNSAIYDMVDWLWKLRRRSPLCVEIFKRAFQAGLRQPISDHNTILEALKSRCSRASRKSMQLHLDNVLNSLLEATESDQRPSVADLRANAKTKIPNRDH